MVTSLIRNLIKENIIKSMISLKYEYKVILLFHVIF